MNNTTKITFLLVLVFFISCRKKDPLTFTHKMAGMHTWTGTKYISSNTYPIPFDLTITVVDNKTIVFPYDPLSHIDTLHYLSSDNQKKTITFVEQYQDPKTHIFDTMVYNYSKGSISYVFDFYKQGISSYIVASTQL